LAYNVPPTETVPALPLKTALLTLEANAAGMLKPAKASATAAVTDSQAGRRRDLDMTKHAPL
jgi:hypothetical protein